MEKGKKKMSIWYKIIPLMLIGALGTAALQYNEFELVKPMDKVINVLEEAYPTISITDIECSEFSCVGVDGVYIETPEFGDNQGLWVYRYADKGFVKASIEQYEMVNTIPNMPNSLYYGEEHYFITATHGISGEQFNGFIETFKKSLGE